MHWWEKKIIAALVKPVPDASADEALRHFHRVCFIHHGSATYVWFCLSITKIIHHFEYNVYWKKVTSYFSAKFENCL